MSNGADSAGFSAQLQAAESIDDPAERRHRLARIAQGNLDFLQVVKLARLIDTLGTPPDAINLAIVSSSTVDHLVDGIRVAGLRRNLLLNVCCGQYGQYRQEILTPSAALADFDPDFVLFSLHAAHLCAGIALEANARDTEAALRRAVTGIRDLWRAAASEFNSVVIQQTCLDRTEPLFGNYDRIAAASPFRLVQELNQMLAEQAGAEHIGLLDIARQCARDGLDHWFDEGRWLQAKMEIAPAAALDYGALLASHIAAHRGQSRKCLVMDLDNTIWGGVVGDDGLEGLKLGQGSGVGEAYLQLQQYLGQLKERGIILAVCSKNDLETAQEPFLRHPDMYLSLDDIAVFVANWDDKAANLQAISKRLNLGLDSLVFLDDNPAERTRIREALPMVAVPELPDDPAGYVRCLANHGYFEAVQVTGEDRQRAAQYAANARRTEFEETAESMDDYLRGLDMQMTVGPVTGVHLDRVTQLIGKTNQFNTTTRRYTRDEIVSFSESDDCVTLQCRLVDRFGDNGLVSAIVLCPHGEIDESLIVANWVMSCRVFGRQLEHELMNIVVERARERGAGILLGEYIPTAKNGVIKTLFRDFGFTAMADGPDRGAESQMWKLRMSDYEPTATHIRVEELQ